MLRNVILLVTILSSLSLWGVTASYYSNANGKSDADLRDALYNITKVGPSGMSYAGLWTAYKTTDVYPTGHANAGKIWDMYSSCVFTYSSDQCGTYSNICDCYNREHSLPKSWFNEATPMYYDLGHIVPTDGKVNGMRSNYPFGEVSSGTSYSISKLGTAKSITVSNTIVNTSGSTTQSCSSSKVFEPADEYKGDFARMYMYMRVRYYNTNFKQDSEGYGQYHFTTTYTKAGYYGLTAYSVALLMKWHRQDPVSQKEIDRNNAMETAQGNRNPFIDYPCLAEYLWGEHTGESFSTSTSVGSFESGFTVGSSTGCSSSSTPTTTYTVTWKVNGSTYTTGSPTTSVTSGSQISTLPTAPSAPTNCSDKVFVGWSTTNIGSTATNTAPSVLFTTASASPAITANTTFYAVFATASSSGSTSSVSFSPDDFSGQGTTGTGSSISATKSGVTFSCDKGFGTTQIRCYSGGTITITSSGSNISAIGFTFSGTYTGGLETSYSGLSTTNWSQSLGSQARITAITITVGGGTTYSGYITTCSSSSSCTQAPTLNAATTSNVTTNSATASCTGITSLGSSGCTISAYGFVYGTSSNPTLASGTVVLLGNSYTTTGTAFSGTLSGLTASTTYYVRSYATNGYNTAYGSQASFTTKTPTSYTVTWKVNGSTYTTGNPTTSVVSGNQVTTLPIAPSAPSACSDKTFVGWSTTNIGSTATNTAPTDLFTTAAASPTITSNTTFYAVFASSGSGGSSSASFAPSDFSGQGTTNTGSAISATNNGVTFACDKGYGTTQIRCYSGGNITISSSSTITAISFTFSNSYTGGMATSYTGLSTTNWTMALTSQARITAATVTLSGGSAEYVTECAISNYTITWNATTNGGSCSTATSTVTAGSAIGTLPTATKDCYTFNGWYTAATGGTKITTATVPTGDVTYYAQFSINSHTLSVAASPATYGSVSGGGTYNCGTSHTITATANTGYAFSYWSLNGSSVSTNASYSVTMPDENVTYTAVFTALPTYTATFKNGTETFATKSGYSGQSITVSTPSACDGYTFVGWSSHEYSGNNTTAPTIDFDGTIPSANTTYYAVYSRQGDATTTLTNNYERITSLSNLTSGNYLVVGYYNNNYYAMRAATTGTYYLAQTAVTSTSNIISNPATNLIWQITVDGSNVTFYNASVAKYAYANRSGTTNYLNLTTGTTGISFAASVNNSIWTFTSSTYTSYRINYQGTNSRFRLYNNATNSIYLYKQKEETTYTTYYTTTTSLTVTVLSEDEAKGTVHISAL